jgi:aspartate kinase
MNISPRRPIAVLKIGGSVLTDLAAYPEAARFVAACRAEQDGARLVVVVSAEQGQTTLLAETAKALTATPDRTALDLLWSTGELRSVALLVLALHALGIRAAGANVHETGVAASDIEGSTHAPRVRPLRLLHLLASHEVVVVPGFLARGDGDRIVSLGRGGSDLTAVLLADALDASTCELVKDVDGYYSSDPDVDPDGHHLAAIDFDRALTMADEGCGLVQRAALVRARERGLPLVVRSIAGQRRTIVGPKDIDALLPREAPV